MRIVFGALIFAVSLATAIGAQAPVTIEQHEATMKMIAQANGALQKNLKGNMLTEAAANAEELGKLFATVEQFWTRNKKDDAIKLAQTARTGAADVAKAAKAGDQMAAQNAAKAVGGTCAGCHKTYREGSPQEGGYRIRADAGVN
jgi:cytochrome c556